MMGRNQSDRKLRATHRQECVTREVKTRMNGKEVADGLGGPTIVVVVATVRLEGYNQAVVAERCSALCRTALCTRSYCDALVLSSEIT